MRSIFRVLGLTFALALATLSYASGSPSPYGGCYVSCPDDQVYHIYTTYGCCGPISTYDFTCPGGGVAYGYAYDGSGGPEFCT